jgi:hypothetical protein
MVHLIAITAILLAVGNAAAQPTATLSVLWVDDSISSITATELGSVSLIGLNPTGTTFAHDCRTTTCDSTDVTYTFGPSSMDGRQTDTTTWSWHCDYTGTTTAVCTTTILGAGSTQSLTLTYSKLVYQTILLTAGAEKLPFTTAGKTTAGGTPSATITSGAATSSATGTGAAGSSKGAGAHMYPSKGWIVAAFLLWGLFG